MIFCARRQFPALGVKAPSAIAFSSMMLAPRWIPASSTPMTDPQRSEWTSGGITPEASMLRRNISRAVASSLSHS